MSRAMPTVPSAPLVERQQLVGNYGPPPPGYDQTVGPSGHIPPGVQPAPYPQQNYMGPGAAIPTVQYISPTLQPAPVLSPPTAVIVTGAFSVGPEPVKMCCPNCHMDIKTTTVTEHKGSAHIACLILFLLGCCLCSCIPYCMDSYKIVRHSCPNCNTLLGVYSP